MRNVRAMVVGVFLSIALFMVGQTAMAKPVITEVLVLYDGNGQPEQLRIEGLDFGTDPIVEIGNFATPLTIAESPCLTDPPTAPIQCLVADLPTDIAAGDFQLSLTKPSISLSCDDGKPGVLQFQYTGDDCSWSNNPQDGKAECIDLDSLGEPVEIVLTKDGSKITVTPNTETVFIGDQVTFSAIDKKLKASLKFEVRQGGTALQSVTIHTSCSKPLNVGDQFGSMLLTEYFPEGLGLDDIVGTYDLTIGAVGPKGDQGPQGDTGPEGAKGDTGDRGLRGFTGVTGAKGDTGDTGPQGLKGDKGDTGPQGPPGTSSWTDGTGIVTTTDNVGIGTTNPQAKLDVNGDIYVKGSPLVLIKRYENTGNDANFDTMISSTDWECVATGWAAVYDINEAGPHINRVWTYVNSSTDTWWATVRFGSHGSDPQDAENPDVDILCFRQEIAEWQGASRTLNDPW